eukprot:TRINITY_DN42378_c0_g1_i1.p1 TRINITY_DN42378_c0_g1~~TRINITY_DN42378_c0_g1_i1.p1  ORF type:complete len:182 (+),score=38.62 TRINITY_DN42378_c0_g1_i1:132-677(+)
MEIPADGLAYELDEGDMYVAMDPDLCIFESTHDLHLRIADREFKKKDQTDYVTLADVEGEMEELKTDKGLDEATLMDIKKALEDLTKNTVLPRPGDRRQQLTAARICEIENRLKSDITLQPDRDINGKVAEPTHGNGTDVAGQVKRNLVRTYAKIKRSNQYELSAVTIHQLDERMAILRKQ